MNESPSERIVTAVAARRETDVVELPPLYDEIDPEKLDQLVESMTNGAVSFTHVGYEVIVTSDGSVTLSNPAESDTARGEASCDA